MDPTEKTSPSLEISAHPLPPTNAGEPPDTIVRERAAAHSGHHPATKLLISLLVAAPRVFVGASYLASALVKGIGGGILLGVSKTNILKGRTEAAMSFSGEALLDARRDLAKGALLALAGILSPFGQLWSIWDRHENQGWTTDLTYINLGSKGKLKQIYPKAALAQDLIDPPNRPLSSHIWKKIERKLDKVADVLTYYKGIERALAKGREQLGVPERERPT